MTFQVYSKILCHEEWYSRLEIFDTDGEINKAAELHYPFGRIEESRNLYGADVRAPGRVYPSSGDKVWSRAIVQYGASPY